MNGTKLDELLQSVSIELRAEAREFVRMPIEDQNLHTFLAVKELRRGRQVKAHIVQAVYTTAIAVGVFYRGIG